MFHSAFSSIFAEIGDNPDGIMLFNSNMQCVYIDSAAEHILGENASRLLGERMLDMVFIKEGTTIISNGVKTYNAIILTGFNPLDISIKEHTINLNGEMMSVVSLINPAIPECIERMLHAAKRTDERTNLPNRKMLLEQISLGNAKACVIFDIDGYKEIVHLFGSHTGECIIDEIAELLKPLCNIYRIGECEFSILFGEEQHHSVLNHRIGTFLSKIEKHDFFINGEHLSVNLNAGASTQGVSMFSDATIALGYAKKTNRSIVFYCEIDDNKIDKRTIHIMPSTIRKALTDERIICMFQPIVNCKTGNVSKYEALVRAIDEEGNIVPPADFLPAAKKTKLYPQITLEVVDQACATFAQRSEEFSINISIDDIKDAYVVQEITRIITHSGTANRVVFEILESEGIHNYKEVASFIANVKELGAKIAIDDFGTGYSNFEHLLRLDVDYIKIDGTLIKGITQNKRHHLVIKTIVDFSNKIGAETIAEFVADEETFDTIKDLGVNFSQGFYTGKPTPLECA